MDEVSLIDAIASYNIADNAYREWKLENPGLDAFEDAEGRVLATRRDDALETVFAAK